MKSWFPGDTMPFTKDSVTETSGFQRLQYGLGLDVA